MCAKYGQTDEKHCCQEYDLLPQMFFYHHVIYLLMLETMNCLLPSDMYALYICTEWRLKFGIYSMQTFIVSVADYE